MREESTLSGPRGPGMPLGKLEISLDTLGRTGACRLQRLDRTPVCAKFIPTWAQHVHFELFFQRQQPASSSLGIDNSEIPGHRIFSIFLLEPHLASAKPSQLYLCCCTYHCFDRHKPVENPIYKIDVGKMQHQVTSARTSRRQREAPLPYTVAVEPSLGPRWIEVRQDTHRRQTMKYVASENRGRIGCVADGKSRPTNINLTLPDHREARGLVVHGARSISSRPQRCSEIHDGRWWCGPCVASGGHLRPPFSGGWQRLDDTSGFVSWETAGRF